jgi:hypothetical protein
MSARGVHDDFPASLGKVGRTECRPGNEANLLADSARAPDSSLFSLYAHGHERGDAWPAAVRCRRRRGDGWMLDERRLPSIVPMR